MLTLSVSHDSGVVVDGPHDIWVVQGMVLAADRALCRSERRREERAGRGGGGGKGDVERCLLMRGAQLCCVHTQLRELGERTRLTGG